MFQLLSIKSMSSFWMASLDYHLPPTLRHSIPFYLGIFVAFSYCISEFSDWLCQFVFVYVFIPLEMRVVYECISTAYEYTYRCVLCASWIECLCVCVFVVVRLNVFIISVFVGFCLWVMMEKYDFIVCSPVLIISMRFSSTLSTRSLALPLLCDDTWSE